MGLLICASDLAGTDQRNPIGPAGAYPGVRKKYPLVLRWHPAASYTELDTSQDRIGLATDHQQIQHENELNSYGRRFNIHYTLKKSFTSVKPHPAQREALSTNLNDTALITETQLRRSENYIGTCEIRVKNSR